MGAYISDKNTIADRVHIIAEHVHTPAKCYPTGAAGVTVTEDAATPWTLGAFAEVVPVSTITKVFDIHYLVMEAISAAGTYEIVLYAATTEIGRIRVTSLNVPASNTLANIPFQCELQPANTQIQAKVMSDNGSSENVTISVFYHEY